MPRFPYKKLPENLGRGFRETYEKNMADIESDIKELNGAQLQALEAANEAQTQSIYAQEQGDYANEQGTFASDQGAFAQAQADRASNEADRAAAEADRVAVVADENKTRFLPAVATVADRDSAYPEPVHGDTVRVTGETKTYRFDSGSGWVVTDQYNPTAIDEVNVKLAETVNSVGVSIEAFKKQGVETDDTARIQRAIDSLQSTGGKIRMENKSYTISSPITLYPNIAIEGIISTDDSLGTRINYTGTGFCFKLVERTGTYGSLFIKNIRFYSASGKGGFLQTGKSSPPAAGQETSGNCVNVNVEDCKILHGVSNPDTDDNSVAFRGWKCIGHKYKNVTVSGFTLAWDYQYSDLNLFEGCKAVNVLQFFKFNWLNTFGSQNHVKDCDLELRRDATLTSNYYSVEDGGYYNRYTNCYFEPGVLDANGNPFASKPKGFLWITNSARSIVFQKCRFAVSLTGGVPNLNSAFIKVDGNSYVTFEDCDAEQPTAGQFLASLQTQKTISKTSDAQGWIQGINIVRCNNNFISFFPVNNPYVRVVGSSIVGYHFDSVPIPNIITPISYSNRYERHAFQNGANSFESNFTLLNDINARDYTVWHLASVQTLGSGNQLVINTPFNSLLRPSTRYRVRLRIKPSASGITTLKLNVGFNLDGNQQFAPVNYNTDAMNAAVYQDVFINFRTGGSAGNAYKLILQAFDTAGTSTWIRVSEIEIIELPRFLPVFDAVSTNVKFVEVANGVIQLSGSTEPVYIGV